MRSLAPCIGLFLAISGCLPVAQQGSAPDTSSHSGTNVSAESRPDALRSLSLPALPLPVSNNAVAGVAIDGRFFLFSFFGLG
ncbi:MAG: hypothetical protein KJO35_09430, partial [Gammaproteobacteria bacterium]|nr:hypothetical protein [Gammaproteobacteria bacterium]